MKKILIFCGRCLTESLTASTTAFVCFLLAVPLKEHGGELAYLLPVILFYACMKTGVFLLHGAVHIDNPYRIMKYCIFMAFAGSFFLLNGNPSDSLFLIGALITGTALSPLSSLYRYVSDTDEQSLNKPVLRQAVSTLIMIAIAVWCIVSKKSGDFSIFRFWCVYLGLICVYITLMPGRKKYSSRKLVSLKNKWLVHSFPALPLFLMMAGVSGYKQSGNEPVYILMLISFIVLIVWILIFDDRHRYIYCSQTVWLGAVRGFEMLFALIYIASTRQSGLTFILYLVILSASFFSPVLAFAFRKFSHERTVWLCMVASAGCLLLLVSGNTVLLLIGVFFCVSFTNSARNANLNSYYNDSSVIQDEYILRQDKMYSLGNGAMQAALMIVFFTAGKLISGHGGSLMKFYVFKDPSVSIGLTLFVGGILSILLLICGLVALYRRRNSD